MPKLHWMNIGNGPTEDTAVSEARVTGGWLYAVYRVQTKMVDREVGLEDVTEILSLAFRPDENKA